MEFPSPEASIHVLMVSFPGQGHVNPLLRLGKILASKGLLVTLTAPEFVGEYMRRANNNNIASGGATPVGNGKIRFEFFKDGWAIDDLRRFHDMDSYIKQLEQVGKEILPVMLKKYEEQGSPVSCLINNPFIPWVSEVAESVGIPNAVLWVQSCACFSAYYHYHHNSVPFLSDENPEIDVQLPCMPVLKYDEVPSFLHPSTPYAAFRRTILGQFKNLSIPFCILMDTIQELEDENIEYMSKFCPIRAIGPMFKQPKVKNLTGFSADFLKAEDCIEWLDSKPQSSVVYISFGSVVYLKQEQVDEFAKGILNSGVSFLWVLRPPPEEFKDAKPAVLPDGFMEKVGDKGRVVKWCPQEQVLAHPSTACFVTHCGWNSTIEALTNGIPVLAFPQWGDQVTNAKYLVDVLKVGVRMSRGEAANRVTTREEIERCFAEIMNGPKAAETKGNVMKWKKVAEEAVAEGGSSVKNMQGFVDDLVKIAGGWSKK